MRVRWAFEKEIQQARLMKLNLEIQILRLQVQELTQRLSARLPT